MGGTPQEARPEAGSSSAATVEHEAPNAPEPAPAKPERPTRKWIWLAFTITLTAAIVLGTGWFALAPKLLEEAQKAAFDTALRTGTVEALDAFVAKYPIGPLADSAKMERDKLKTAAEVSAKLNELRVAIKGDANGRIKAADFEFVANGVKLRLLPQTQSLRRCRRRGGAIRAGNAATGDVGHIDSEGAFKAFSEAAMQNYPDAQANLALIYQNGMLKTGRDLSKARHWFDVASENGDAKAEFWLGCYYQYGWGGVPRTAAKLSNFSKRQSPAITPRRKRRWKW